MTYIAKLRTIVTGWGGDIITLTEDAYSSSVGQSGDYSEAPFVTGKMGINYKKKLLYITQESANPSFMIHELGHIFASRDAPDQVDEFSFMGWEVSLAKQIGHYREWSKYNVDYIVSNTSCATWGELSAYARGRLAAERVEYGIKRGIISRDGTPLSVRT